MILRSSVRALGFFAALISLASPTRGEPAREMVGKCRLTVASLQVEAEHDAPKHKFRRLVLGCV